MKHFQFSTKLFNNLKEMAEEAKEESIEYDGGYETLDLALVPIEDINIPEIWSQDKPDAVMRDIQAGKPLNPIDLRMVRGKYQISDGIHRANASLLLGFTHIPAIISTWHQVRELEESDEILNLAKRFEQLCK